MPAVNLTKSFYKQEELIINALGVNSQRLGSYTKRLKPEVVKRIEQQKPRTIEQLNRAFYGYHNTNPRHYDNSRYQTLNLHNIFFRGTLEIRAFETTLHAGKIKAYIQFCLALGIRAINAKSASSKKREYKAQSAKYDLRVFLLSLGMKGDEYKNTRMHLLKNMPGDAAFKNGRPQNQATTAVA